MMKVLNNPKKNSVSSGHKRTVICEVNKMCENSEFLFFHAMSELFTLKTLSVPR